MMKRAALFAFASFSAAAKGHHGGHDGGDTDRRRENGPDAWPRGVDDECWEHAQEHCQGTRGSWDGPNKFQALACVLRSNPPARCKEAVQEAFPAAACVPELAENCPTLGVEDRPEGDGKGHGKGGKGQHHRRRLLRHHHYNDDEDDKDYDDEHRRGKGGPRESRGRRREGEKVRAIRCLHAQLVNSSLSSGCSAAISATWALEREQLQLPNTSLPMASDVFALLAPVPLTPCGEECQPAPQSHMVLKIAIPVATCLLLAAAAFCCYRRRKKQRTAALENRFQRPEGEEEGLNLDDREPNAASAPAGPLPPKVRDEGTPYAHTRPVSPTASLTDAGDSVQFETFVNLHTAPIHYRPLNGNIQ